MKLTVLGKYGPFPPRGGATSSYLVQEGHLNLLLDFGSGALSRMQEWIAIEQMDMILLSHLHSDHTADLYILAYALNLLRDRGVNVPAPLKVFAPPDPGDEFQRLAQLGVYEMTAIESGMKVRLGPLEIRFHPMAHPAPSFGFDIRCGGRRLFYTGDTSYHENLVPAAKDADLLLADANLLESGRGNNRVLAHLTAEEAGKAAGEANVSRLVLTHIWPDVPEERVRAEAAAHYPAAEIAQERQSYEI